MKAKQIFWGVFLISIGILILLRSYLDIDIDWGDIWKLWPLVIVLIGVNLMIKNNAAKSLISGVTALLLAFALYASVTSFFGWFEHEAEFNIDGDYDYEVYNYNTPFENGIKNAKLHVAAGAGSFVLNDTTGLLFDAAVEGKRNKYSLTANTDSEEANIIFEMESAKFFHKNKNRVEMKLNPAPVWNLSFDIGAAAADFDFSKFDVENIEIHMGAASLNLKIGEMDKNTNVNIEAGASSIEIDVPEKSGCEITADVSLSSKSFDGFSKQDGNIYRTENFDSADKKIFINIESGISSIKVNRISW